MAKIGIVIPTLDNLEYTQKCIASLEKYGLTSEQVFIIIDNGSDAETMKWYREYKSPFTMIVDVCGENRMVNRSWNAGLEIAKENGCEYVAFINNDIEVSGDWFGEMQRIFESNPNIWCVCPHYTRLEKPENFEELAKERWNNPNLALGEIGFFFVVKLTAFEELEKLDGEFGFSRQYDGGLWYEDKDFFLRLKNAGHNPIVAKHILIHHYESKTLKKMEGLNKLKENNLKAFQKRWGYNPNIK